MPSECSGKKDLVLDAKLSSPLPALSSHQARRAGEAQAGLLGNQSFSGGAEGRHKAKPKETTKIFLTLPHPTVCFATQTHSSSQSWSQ